MSDTLNLNGYLVGQAKSFLLSRTIWANILATPLAWLAARHVPVDADTQTGLISGILAVMNIALRFITTRPISLTLPARPGAGTWQPDAKEIDSDEGGSLASRAGPTLALALLLPLGLAGCAGTGSTVTTAQVVARVQADYPVVKAAFGVYLASPGATPQARAAITAGERLLDPEIAALSALSSPLTVQSAIDGIATVVTALPPGTLSAPAQADIALLLALAHAGLTIATPAAG